MKLQEQINRIHEMMGVNESFGAWFMRRFSPEELDNLIKNVKDLTEIYEYEEDAIYDAVRQLIATKNFEDINSAETDNQYWDSYLKYEGPLVKYVKERLSNEELQEQINESNKSYIQSEMDEIERAVQDLSRDEDINISVKELKEKFKNAEPKKLTKSIWSKLENTESNEIDKGDMKSVEKIAKKYNKTNPNKLKKSLESGDYNPPMIIQFGNRYHLVAGNTRLCTAAAMGITPNVLIVKI
jgi:hypothetical protein